MKSVQVRDVSYCFALWHVLPHTNNKYEWKGVSKDRKPPVAPMGVRVAWQGQSANLAVACDISDRNQTGEALRQSEAKYRALFNNIADPVFIFDQETHRFLDCNQTALRRYGYTLEDLRNVTPVQLHPPDEVGIVEKNIRDKEDFSPHYYTHMTKDGECFPVEIHTNKLDYEGRKAWMSIVRDISERKRSEEEYCQHLETLVKEQTAELSRANVELARAARLKNEFLAMMNHEIRTPLHLVLGMSEVLREEIPGPLNDRQREFLRMIEVSGRHLLDILTAMLDLSAIGAGKVILDKIPFDAKSLCQSSLCVIAQAAHKKGLTVSCMIDQAIPLIHADEKRVKQILVHLLDNAVKFTPEGGTIGLEVERDAEQHVVCFTVWDTGIGIPREDMERIFEPFVQLDAKLSRKYKGTGLGLALVQRLIELHGGRISVESEIDKGSRFTVVLPLQKPIDSIQASSL